MRRILVVLVLLFAQPAAAQWHQWTTSEETDLRTLNQATLDVAILTERVANDYRTGSPPMTRTEMFEGLEDCWLAVEKMDDALNVFAHGDTSKTISDAYNYVGQAVAKLNSCASWLTAAGSDEAGSATDIAVALQSIDTSDPTRFGVWQPTTYPDFPLCPLGYDSCNVKMNNRVDGGPAMALQGMYDIVAFYNPLTSPVFSQESAQQVWEAVARERLFIIEVVRARATLMGATLSGDDPLMIHSELALERFGFLQQPETGRNSLFTALIDDNGFAWYGEQAYVTVGRCKNMGSCGHGYVRVAEWEADHVQFPEGWPVFGYFGNGTLPPPPPSTCGVFVPTVDVIIDGVPVECVEQ